MLGGILFVIIVWFLPILIWYFVQGRKEFNRAPNCAAQADEIAQSKYMFYGALGFGVFIIILILILG